MDYVDWLEKVLDALATTLRKQDPETQHMAGVAVGEVAAALGFDTDAMSSAPGTPEKALWDAFKDLMNMSLAERGVANGFIKLTQEGRKFPEARLPSSWRRIMEIYIEDDERTFLSKLGELCQEDHETYVCLRERLIDDVSAALGWDEDRGWYTAQSLIEKGLARRSGAVGAVTTHPTYTGLVRVTRELESEWSQVIRGLVPEWETTNVDFKRELNVSRDKEKAEFVRDTLALANTKSSGRRFMVIGFDPKSHDFVQSIDPKITQDRLEDILGAYAQPVPDIQLHRVTYEEGTAGIIEVTRDTVKLPYRVKSTLAHISAGDVFVRHGSHTAKPDQEESDELAAEGDQARKV